MMAFSSCVNLMTSRFSTWRLYGYPSSQWSLDDSSYNVWLLVIFALFAASRCQASLSFTALLLVASHSIYLRRKSADVDGSDGETAMGSTSHIPLKTILRDHWRGLLGAGLYCALLNGVRNTWMVALPLRGHHIGLSKLGIGASVAWYRACDAAVTTIAAGWGRNKEPGS